MTDKDVGLGFKISAIILIMGLICIFTSVCWLAWDCLVALIELDVPVQTKILTIGLVLFMVGLVPMAICIVKEEKNEDGNRRET